MVFSSLTFLWLFLPLFILCYYAAQKTARNIILLIFSLIFYAWGEPVYVLLLVFSTILDYTCGRMIDKHRGTKKAKTALIVSIVCNVALLTVFKYSDFFIATINSVFRTSIPLLHLPLPIGISFYTFQTMSYSIDVYRNEAKVQRNILNFGMYVSLFPQLIAGPIVRYQTIADQIDSRQCTKDLFGDGAKRFAIGLGKKVLLANNIGLLWDTVSSSDPLSLSVVGAWTGIVAFAFQIYFDFSGYSDMAIGLGKMIGFTFLENFDHPYMCRSITEFWRRWHISLGTWFRDYVYIPLGGNRKGLALQIRNILIVWLLTGFWHGASWNFVIWGLFYGLMLMIEKFFLLKKLDKWPAWIGRVYTLILVLIGWVFFAFDDIRKGLAYIGVMFGSGRLFCDQQALYLLLSFLPLILICAFASGPWGKKIYDGLSAKRDGPVLQTAEVAGLLLITVVCIVFLISGSFNPFLYFRF